MIKSSQVIYINSKNRLSGTDSDFTYTIQKPFNSKYNKVLLLRAQIPKSYYVIDSDNDAFFLSENGVETECVLTHGRYSLRSLLTELLASLAIAGNYTYGVSFPNSSTEIQTGKFTFTVTGNGGNEVYFRFPDSYSPNEIMGFDWGSTNIFVNGELISTNVINVGGENTLFIHSDLCHNGTNSVLSDIYSNAGTNNFSNIVFENKASGFDGKIINYSSNNTYYFKLTDEDGRILNLNGQNILLTILLYEEYSYISLLKDIALILLENTYKPN